MATSSTNTPDSVADDFLEQWQQSAVHRCERREIIAVFSSACSVASCNNTVSLL